MPRRKNGNADDDYVTTGGYNTNYGHTEGGLTHYPNIRGSNDWAKWNKNPNPGKIRFDNSRKDEWFNYMLDNNIIPDYNIHKTGVETPRKRNVVDGNVAKLAKAMKIKK